MVSISNVGQAILSAYNQYKKSNFTPPKTTPQNARTLPRSVVAAQQALSEKFGIPTFDIQGKVSTIPRTVPLNTMINVGVGSTGLQQNVFNDLLARFSPSKPLVPVQEVFTPGLGFSNFQPVGAAPAPGEMILPSAPGIFDSLKGGLADIQRSIGPAGVVIGLGLVAFLLLRK